MAKYVISSICMLVLSTLLVQGQATFRGKVSDGENGEALMGATVAVFQGENVVGGAYTDLEGNYSVSVQPGTFTVIVTYISYVSDTLANVNPCRGRC